MSLDDCSFAMMALNVRGFWMLPRTIVRRAGRSTAHRRRRLFRQRMRILVFADLGGAPAASGGHGEATRNSARGAARSPRKEVRLIDWDSTCFDALNSVLAFILQRLTRFRDFRENFEHDRLCGAYQNCVCRYKTVRAIMKIFLFSSLLLASTLATGCAFEQTLGTFQSDRAFGQ